MITDHDSYAVFEANQVLTEAHLNDMFAYLDEQQRLTRADLIGIGIVCGLEIERADDGTIALAKGCGVTSQGYLVVEPRDVPLVSWRPYTLPDQLDYPSFEDSVAPRKQFPLWELFPAGEPGAQPLGSGGLSLDDKAVVLFLELKREDLRTCSPNSCDDRGAAVTATVRRLLVGTTDLDKVIAAADRLDGGLALGTGEADVLARLQLPDLRLPRVDVPNSGPVSSEDVLAAFQRAFLGDQLADRTGKALSQAYQVFRPLLAKAYPTDPFADFRTTFGFLDDVPTTTVEVRFLQYYWDLFDDLLRAYDEFRWSGVDLMCACCPPDGLFPRHLMLGVVTPAAVPQPEVYRHRFLASPAGSDCGNRTRDVLLLFRRLVGMVDSFTNDPPLPSVSKRGVRTQIRITPSVWGRSEPLGATAIPYYYRQDGAPPLYRVWNPERSRRRRADQNLGYRADEYGAGTPGFVTDPLRYELEQHNFLRIEGHLGTNVQTVTSTLLTYASRYRLPIEVVALRTGAFDESAPVDLAKEDCRFADLEAIYATLKAELACFLCKEVRYFYDLPHQGNSPVTDPRPPVLGLLAECAPDYLVRPGTLGRLIEDALGRQRGTVLARRPAAINPRDLFAFSAFSLVTALEQLWAQLSEDVRHVDFDRFGAAYADLVEVAEQFEGARRAAVDEGDPGYFGAPGLEARLGDILFRCRLEPFRALQVEYQRRVREVRQAQFLSFFLQRHPGIQHKSGVPLGGTFILVYHESVPTVTTRPGFDRVLVAETVGEPGPALRKAAGERSAPGADAAEEEALSRALTRLEYDVDLAANPDVQDVFQLLTGKVLVGRRPPRDDGTRIYVDAVAELGDGTVIADFFLPYICCSDCAPIHFALAKDRPQLHLQVGCTNADGNAEVTLTPSGATGAVSVQVDGGPFEASTGALLLPVGAHTVVIRDDDGTESAPTPVTVPPLLRTGDAQTIDDEHAGTYQVTFEVSGGTPPYAAAPGALAGSRYTSPAVTSGQAVTVTIRDTAGCAVEETFRHTVEPVCDLPCDGEAVRTGFRFWLPVPKLDLPLVEYRAKPVSLRIGAPDGSTFDLDGDVTAIVNGAPGSLPGTQFDQTVAGWMADINKAIAGAVGSDQWVRVEYTPPDKGGTTGTLWIDRLQCLDVLFTLEVGFSAGQQRQRVRIEYSTKGTSLVDRVTDVSVFVPAFDPTMSNKCHPERPPVHVCAEVDLQLDIRREGFIPDLVALTAVPSGGEPPVAFLWEVQDAQPALASGESAAFRFDPPEPTAKLVRLTAYTGRGCTAVLEQRIDIKG